MKLLKKIPVHPTFILFFIWFAISGRIVDFFVFFIVLLLHEMGHYWEAKRLGYKLQSFYLTPCGVELNYKDNQFSNEDEIKISLAGPFVNLLFAIGTTALWWLFPALYSWTYLFVFQNVILALINLLPAYPLDGGRVMVSFFSKYFSKLKVLKFSKINNLIFAGIFLILFIISCFINYNPSLALMAMFLLSGMLNSNKEGKYEMISFCKKQNKNFSKVRVVYINTDVTLGQILRKIESNKYTLFYLYFGRGKEKILSEDNVINLSLQYNLDKKINQIFNINKIDKK